MSEQNEQEGPDWTDEDGVLPYPYLSCGGCKWRRVHDFHYFYCRDLGGKTQADFTSVYSGGMKRIWTHPHPDENCRFLPDGYVRPDYSKPKPTAAETATNRLGKARGE